MPCREETSASPVFAGGRNFGFVREAYGSRFFARIHRRVRLVPLWARDAKSWRRRTPPGARHGQQSSRRALFRHRRLEGLGLIKARPATAINMFPPIGQIFMTASCFAPNDHNASSNDSQICGGPQGRGQGRSEFLERIAHRLACLLRLDAEFGRCESTCIRARP